MIPLKIKINIHIKIRNISWPHFQVVVANFQKIAIDLL